MSNIDYLSSRGPHCLWLPCKSGGRHRMTHSTILEFVSKHCKEDKRHDCVGMIGLGFEVMHVIIRRRRGANSMTHTTLHTEKDKPQLVSIMTMR